MTSSLGRARVAIVMSFVVNGVMFGSWASRIPAIKEQAGLDAFHLGFALLGSSLGSVLTMTLAGYAAGRIGSHRLAPLALLGCASVMPVIASSASFLALAGALFLYGSAQGCMAVAINANGLAIERAGTKPIMSRLHGSWSVGSFVGAFSTALALRAGLSVFQQFVVLGIVMAVSAAILSQTMLAEKHAVEGPAFRRPPRRLAIIGAIAMCALVAEGSTGDWSGVFIKDTIGGTAQDAAIAISVFWARLDWSRLAPWCQSWGSPPRWRSPSRSPRSSGSGSSVSASRPPTRLRYEQAARSRGSPQAWESQQLPLWVPSGPRPRRRSSAPLRGSWGCA
jgi:hypothetical protein